MLLFFFEIFTYVLAGFFLLEMLLRLNGTKFSSEEQELEQAVADFEDAVVLCKVEQIGNVYYLYNSQNDNFVGQARTAQEIVDLSESIQKHIMIVDGDDNVVDNLKVLIDEVRS